MKNQKKMKRKSGLWIVVLLFIWATEKMKQQLKTERKKTDKYEELYKLLAQWMEIKQNKQSIGKWIRENRYQTVAVYGLYLIGERLYVELTDEKVNVVYGIDRKCRNYLKGIKVYRPTDDLPHADLIIVTAVAEFEEIKKQLKDKTDSDIISMKDMLYEASIS